MKSANLVLPAICAAQFFQAACAQSAPDVSACLKLSKDGERMACYDRAHGYQHTAAPAETQPESGKKPTFYLRDRGTIGIGGGAEFGQKGATLSSLHSGGTSTVVAKIGAIVVFPAKVVLGLQPFVSAEIDKDGAGAARKEVLTANAGVAGPIWQTPGDTPEQIKNQFTLLSTVILSRREDRFGTTDALRLRAHADGVYKPWVVQPVSFLPSVGYLGERRSNGGADHGFWGTVYAGAALTTKLSALTPNLTASLEARFFRDSNAPAGNARRNLRYANLSLDYFPLGQEAIPFRPSLFITRETGTDVITSGAQTNKTTVGLRVQYN